MKRGSFLRTAAVLLGLILAGFAGKNLFWGSSTRAARQGVSSQVISARAKAAPPASDALDVAVAEAGVASTNKLFLTSERLWARPVPEEPFARFHDWAEKFLTASPQSRPALETEGIELAKTRRQAMAALIKSDPERALDLAAPQEVRQGLPPSISDLLEERVSGRGRLAVLGALPEPGKENEVPTTFRTATLGEREFQAFVYRRRLGQPTRDNIPLNGIALDNLLALSENPLRILSPAEAAAAKARVSDPICAVSGLRSTVIGQEVAAEVAGEPIFLCRGTHAVELNNRLVAAEGGAPGPASSQDEVAPSTWTEGKKKMIVIRVDFPDLVGAPMADSTGISMISGLDAFYTEMSYGRAGYYTNGAGSDLTPTFRMPQPAGYYGTNDYYNQLRTDARNAATAAGYTVTSYDRDVICMGAVPGWGWSGLGYVGAAGSWLRSSFSVGVAGHELGHNEGLNHANFWDTSSQSIIGPGTSIEYGDSFDTMGSASAGNNHFNARYKSYLNWLTSNETVNVTSNGTYRIYAHDDPNSTGLRGLRIVKAGTTNYWVEFRQKFTGNKWLMNGAGLRWAQNGNEKSQLLDTTPGSTDGKNDSAVVIGRTFNDDVGGVHITPIGKGGTSPESLDVVVNLGSSPSNLPPVVDVTPSATTAAVGAALSFTATASDPNGDSLAYYWDFGDGNFGSNSPAATKSWNSTGEYVVRCVVSDMKGGEAAKSVIVTIGSPTTYRISGHVATTNGPVEGVRVYVSTTRMAYTDSDGAYTIVGLPAGSYTVNATLYNYVFSGSGFVNPVSVGPTANNIDFAATFTTYSPPTITSQPLSQTVNPGASATFTVVAVGTAPLYYQWRFNGANISGASGSSYTKTNVQATNAGNYSVVVSNSAGTIASANAVLTVNTPPNITGQPQSQAVIAGNVASLNVSASGSTPLYYQWRQNGTNLAGATTATYTCGNAQLPDAGNYVVIVTNSLGAATSSPASLTINFLLDTTATYGGTVTKNPNQPSYAANTLVTLSASAASVFPFTGWSGDATGSNNPLSILMTSNKTIVANFTSTVPDLIVDNPAAAFAGSWTTSTSAADKYGADYRIAASTPGAASATATFTPNFSTAGTYDLYAWFPSITKGCPSTPVEIYAAGTNFTLSVSQVSASGGWELLVSGLNFARGTNGFVLVGNNTGQGGKNVVADAFRWVYSTAQLLSAPLISGQPQSQRVLEGAGATFDVTVNGADPLTFQWRFNTVPIANQTNASLTLPTVHPANAGDYDVIVSNPGGDAASLPANLVVSVRPTLGAMTILTNKNAQIILTGTAGDRYTLEFSTNLLNWTAGVTLTNLTGTIQFTDSQATNLLRRFYRCRLLP